MDEGCMPGSSPSKVPPPHPVCKPGVGGAHRMGFSWRAGDPGGVLSMRPGGLGVTPPHLSPQG